MYIYSIYKIKMLISTILKKKREKSKKTVLGVDINSNGIAISKLIYDGVNYNLDTLDFIDFEENFQNISDIDPDIFSEKALDFLKLIDKSKRLSLGMIAYLDVDILLEEINIKDNDMKNLNNYNLRKYIVNNHLSKKLPEISEKNMYFHCEDLNKEYNSNKFYYIHNSNLVEMYKSLEKSLKRKISILTTDIEALEAFIQNFYTNKINNTNKHIFLGLYKDKFSFYTLSNDKVTEHETFSFSNSSISNNEYIEEIVPYILKILDLSSFDFNMDNDFMFSDSEEKIEEIKTKLHIFGTHNNLEEILTNLTDFISCDYELVNTSSIFNNNEIEKCYRYVMSLGLSTMLEA